jgi:hypothetical protein
MCEIFGFITQRSNLKRVDIDDRTIPSYAKSAVDGFNHIWVKDLQRFDREA